MKILDLLLNYKFDRNDCILALGGGVAGDLAGFISSIYLRGVPFIQIPTSLMAMTDSSVGGKTGINLETGKNLAGTFYQPQAVLIDPLLLKTLPMNELLNGMSEVVKYGIISDPKFFSYIEKNVRNVLKKDPTVLNKLITQSCKIKSNVVKKDEHEKGLRMILNYGHTMGHALEKLSSYKIKHGEAVAIGMKLINIICTKKRILKKEDLDRINNLINSLGLIRKPYRSIINKNNATQIWEIIKNDKKVRKGIIKFVIPTNIGTVKISDNTHEVKRSAPGKNPSRETGHIIISKKDIIFALENYDRN